MKSIIHAKTMSIVGGVILFALITSLANSIGDFTTTIIEKLPIHEKNKIYLKATYILINFIIIIFLANYVFRKVKLSGFL